MITRPPLPRAESPAAPHSPGSRPALRRRGFLSRLALGVGVGAAAWPRLARNAHAATPESRVLEVRVISWQPTLYHGWPTIARRRNGDLWLVWSGGRESHVCPFGQVQAMTSYDGGERWTWPRVLLDSPIDDRDAGVVETAAGSLLVTSFSSLAYVPGLLAAEKGGTWPPEKLARWQAAHRRAPDEARQRELGQWMLRSTDGGLTWSARQACAPNSPHGPILLRSGTLLYAGKELWTGDRRTGFWQSTDDGRTWDWLAALPVRPGHEAAEYHELHAVEAPSGRLLAHIRNENETHENETLQSESDDGGRSWSVPHRLKVADGSEGVWGLPSHLLRLADGRILMTYGHRRAPLGNQARLSTDEGRTWSAPLVISADGTRGDLGYPSTVELDDGTLLTVWYEVLEGASPAVLRQARWRLAG